MSLDADAKKVLLRKIPHGLFICGVRNGDEVNGFTASWVTQGSFEPPLVVMASGQSRWMVLPLDHFQLALDGMRS